MKVKYLIIGAGPTGLGAANRLRELGEDSFAVLERLEHTGGLSASFTDPAGFTWDIGGHVIFSHYEYFDALLDDLLDGKYLEHQRESWVRACGTWVPYPFQNNIRHLPPETRWKCVQGLFEKNRPHEHPQNFGQWIDHVFGPGIAEVFLRPYNFKVWATPPDEMQYSWIGERVSVIELESVLKSIVLEQDDVGWGPNNTFRFPLTGGTGQIFRKLAERVQDAIHTQQSVAEVDAEARTVRTEQGLRVEYEYLLNTAPLDLLAGQWLCQRNEAMTRAAAGLSHNGVYVAGVGLDKRDHPANSRCWMYFPEDDAPFYRTTNFHNYSPNNVADPGNQLAFMCETSFSEHKPEDKNTLMQRTVDGLVNTTLLEPDRKDDLLTRWETSVGYGYPVPCLQRDEALREIQPRLERLGIFSRGRFGGWKYEVGNMDHSVMQGVEWAERMIQNTNEKTYSWE
jgi:UDP-galactopyranose mutase